MRRGDAALTGIARSHAKWSKKKVIFEVFVIYLKETTNRKGLSYFVRKKNSGSQLYSDLLVRKKRATVY